MRTMPKYLLLHIIGALATCIGLSGVAGCGGIRHQVKKIVDVSAVTTIKWYIVLNATDSLPEHAFERYKVEFARDAVLCRMMQGEELCVVAMDDRPADDVLDFTLDPPTRDELPAKYLELYDAVKRVRRRPPEQKGTDFGAVLRFLRQRVESDIAARKRAGHGQDYKYVMVVLTDGFMEKKQIEDIGVFPAEADVQIFLCGLNPPPNKPGEEPTPEEKRKWEDTGKWLSWRHPGIPKNDREQLVLAEVQDRLGQWDLGNVKVETRLWGDRWLENFIPDRQQSPEFLTLLRTNEMPLGGPVG